MATGFQSPPRMFGDWAKDGPALAEWFKSITAANLEQQETIGKLGGAAGDVNPDDLPDPSSSNVATSQKTANDAYLAALAAKTLAANLVFSGSVPISDLATTGDATFATAQADTSYFVQATISKTTGTPAANSTVIAGLTKTTAKATLTVGAAPGTGNSVIFDVMVTRAPAA